jgi:hypothetical protein
MITITAHDPPWEYGPPGRPSDSASARRPTHAKVNPRRPRTTVTTNQLIILSALSPSLKKEYKTKKKDDRHNIAPWCTTHARPAPPPSFFYLHLIILFVIIVGVSVNVSSTKKGPRCTRKRLCRPPACRYIRTKRIRPIRSATVWSSRLSVHSLPALPLNLKKYWFYAAYQQPIKYNFAVTREILKHVYTAERLQPPTSLGAVLGTYSTLWARARSIGYWRDVVRSGEYARLGVYALEAYGIFKVRDSPSPPAFFIFKLSHWRCVVLNILAFSFSCRLERSSVVGHSWGITCSRAARDDMVSDLDFRLTPNCCKSTGTRFTSLKFQTR